MLDLHWQWLFTACLFDFVNRRPQSRFSTQDSKQEGSKNKKDDDEEDNWEVPEGELPFWLPLAFLFPLLVSFLIVALWQAVGSWKCHWRLMFFNMPSKWLLFFFLHYKVCSFHPEFECKALVLQGGSDLSSWGRIRQFPLEIGLDVWVGEIVDLFLSQLARGTRWEGFCEHNGPCQDGKAFVNINGPMKETMGNWVYLFTWNGIKKGAFIAGRTDKLGMMPGI